MSYTAYIEYTSLHHANFGQFKAKQVLSVTLYEICFRPKPLKKEITNSYLKQLSFRGRNLIMEFCTTYIHYLSFPLYTLYNQPCEPFSRDGLHVEEDCFYNVPL